MIVETLITTGHLLVFFVVREANEGKMVACEGFRNSKGFIRSIILLYVLKITGVHVTGQLWNHWRDG